mmetsp:Transcript_4627/g.16608  ORF Transcript_4627/g.16608 Transcript_4627/m.16608 type:complete len:266 (+) Transcript_4627:308-1105(+)
MLPAKAAMGSFAITLAVSRPSRMESSIGAGLSPLSVASIARSRRFSTAQAPGTTRTMADVPAARPSTLSTAARTSLIDCRSSLLYCSQVVGLGEQSRTVRQASWPGPDSALSQALAFRTTAPLLVIKASLARAELRAPPAAKSCIGKMPRAEQILSTWSSSGQKKSSIPSSLAKPWSLAPKAFVLTTASIPQPSLRALSLPRQRASKLPVTSQYSSPDPTAILASAEAKLKSSREHFAATSLDGRSGSRLASSSDPTALTLAHTP